MKITHRYNSEERQHFLLKERHYFKLKPRLLYAGILSRQNGWKDNTHTHNFVEIMFVLNGKGQIFHNDDMCDITKGDIIIYNSDIPHREQSSDSDPLELLFIALDKVDIAGLQYNHMVPDSYGVVYPSGDLEDIFRNYFTLIVDETAGKDKFYIEIATNATITLVMYIYRLINRFNDISNVMNKDSVFDDVVSYIDTHFLEPVTLDDIARACHISKSYLSHMFRDVKKQSVMQYVLNKRLEYAKNLILTTKLTVEEIALSSGFNNPSYFSRVFKEIYSVTPLSIRKKKGGSALSTPPE